MEPDDEPCLGLPPPPDSDDSACSGLPPPVDSTPLAPLPVVANPLVTAGEYLANASQDIYAQDVFGKSEIHVDQEGNRVVGIPICDLSDKKVKVDMVGSETFSNARINEKRLFAIEQLKVLCAMKAHYSFGAFSDGRECNQANTIMYDYSVTPEEHGFRVRKMPSYLCIQTFKTKLDGFEGYGLQNISYSRLCDLNHMAFNDTGHEDENMPASDEDSDNDDQVGPEHDQIFWKDALSKQGHFTEKFARVCMDGNLHVASDDAQAVAFDTSIENINSSGTLFCHHDFGVPASLDSETYIEDLLKAVPVGEWVTIFWEKVGEVLSITKTPDRRNRFKNKHFGKFIDHCIPIASMRLVPTDHDDVIQKELRIGPIDRYHLDCAAPDALRTARVGNGTDDIFFPFPDLATMEAVCQQYMDSLCVDSFSNSTIFKRLVERKGKKETPTSGLYNPQIRSIMPNQTILPQLAGYVNPVIHKVTPEEVRDGEADFMYTSRAVNLGLDSGLLTVSQDRKVLHLYSDFLNKTSDIIRDGMSSILAPNQGAFCGLAALTETVLRLHEFHMNVEFAKNDYVLRENLGLDKNNPRHPSGGDSPFDCDMICSDSGVTNVSLIVPKDLNNAHDMPFAHRMHKLFNELYKSGNSVFRSRDPLTWYPENLDMDDESPGASGPKKRKASSPTPGRCFTDIFDDIKTLTEERLLKLKQAFVVIASPDMGVLADADLLYRLPHESRDVFASLESTLSDAQKVSRLKMNIWHKSIMIVTALNTFYIASWLDTAKEYHLDNGHGFKEGFQPVFSRLIAKEVNADMNYYTLNKPSAKWFVYENFIKSLGITVQGIMERNDPWFYTQVVSLGSIGSARADFDIIWKARKAFEVLQPADLSLVDHRKLDMLVKSVKTTIYLCYAKPHPTPLHISVEYAKALKRPESKNKIPKDLQGFMSILDQVNHIYNRASKEQRGGGFVRKTSGASPSSIVKEVYSLLNAVLKLSRAAIVQLVEFVDFVDVYCQYGRWFNNSGQQRYENGYNLQMGSPLFDKRYFYPEVGINGKTQFVALKMRKKDGQIVPEHVSDYSYENYRGLADPRSGRSYEDPTFDILAGTTCKASDLEQCGKGYKISANGSRSYKDVAKKLQGRALQEFKMDLDGPMHTLENLSFYGGRCVGAIAPKSYVAVDKLAKNYKDWTEEGHFGLDLLQHNDDGVIGYFSPPRRFPHVNHPQYLSIFASFIFAKHGLCGWIGVDDDDAPPIYKELYESFRTWAIHTESKNRCEWENSAPYTGSDYYTYQSFEEGGKVYQVPYRLERWQRAKLEERKILEPDPEGASEHYLPAVQRFGRTSNGPSRSMSAFVSARDDYILMLFLRQACDPAHNKQVPLKVNTSKKQLLYIPNAYGDFNQFKGLLPWEMSKSGDCGGVALSQTMESVRTWTAERTSEQDTSSYENMKFRLETLQRIELAKECPLDFQAKVFTENQTRRAATGASVNLNYDDFAQIDSSSLGGTVVAATSNQLSSGDNQDITNFEDSTGLPVDEDFDALGEDMGGVFSDVAGVLSDTDGQDEVDLLGTDMFNLESYGLDDLL